MGGLTAASVQRERAAPAGSHEQAAVWLPFAVASFGLALTAGFGLGGGLFAAVALGRPVGLWWQAAAQAHGHVQLFGWAGLLVLGVGFHFLPRLRGGPPRPARHTRLVLALAVTGLLLRVFVQPWLAALGVDEPFPGAGALLRGGLVLSGALELGAASLALWSLTGVLRHGPPVRQRGGLWPVLPFFVSAFLGLWLALAGNLVGLVLAARAGATAAGIVPSASDRITIWLALYGFLLPVTVAMSERLFPLYFRTPRPRYAALRAGLGLLLAGLALRIVGLAADVPLAEACGQISTAGALAAFVFGLRLFSPRDPLPRRQVRPLRDPVQLHGICAYLWLLVAAVLLALAGAASAAGGMGTGGTTWLPLDAERHVLGAGFITLLILGVGAYLLPGFARRPLRSTALVWLTLVLGNLAAVLRSAPVLLGSVIPTPAVSPLLATAGAAGMLAVATLATNLVTGGRRVPLEGGHQLPAREAQPQR